MKMRERPLSETLHHLKDLCPRITPPDRRKPPYTTSTSALTPDRRKPPYATSTSALTPDRRKPPHTTSTSALTPQTAQHDRTFNPPLDCRPARSAPRPASSGPRAASWAAPGVPSDRAPPRTPPPAAPARMGSPLLRWRRPALGRRSPRPPRPVRRRRPPRSRRPRVTLTSTAAPPVRRLFSAARDWSVGTSNPATAPPPRRSKCRRSPERPRRSVRRVPASPRSGPSWVRGRWTVRPLAADAVRYCWRRRRCRYAVRINEGVPKYVGTELSYMSVPSHAPSSSNSLASSPLPQTPCQQSTSSAFPQITCLFLGNIADLPHRDDDDLLGDFPFR